MPQKTSPFIEAKYGWSYGESQWNTGVDEDLLKFSYLFDSTVIGLVDTLPTAVNGNAYYLKTDKRIYYVVEGAYYSTPLPQWFEFKIKSSGALYVFDGTLPQLQPALSDLSSAIATKANSSDVTTSLATKANIASPTFSGTVAVPTTSTFKTPSTIAVNVDTLNQAFGQLGRVVLDTAQQIAALDTGRVKRFSTMGYNTIGDGGQGDYYIDASDTTSVANNGTVWVANGVRIKLIHNNITDLRQWGVVNNGTDQAAKIQAAINWAGSITGTSEGVRGGLTSPPGMPLVIASSLVFDTPIYARFKSFIQYTPTTGAAIIAGSVAPTISRTDFDVELEGLRAINGNSADPTGYNTSGSIGIEYRNVQFSDFKCKAALAFTFAGYYFNSTNNIYSGQHMQDNDFNFGILGYNGIGIFVKSISASVGATQVNRFKIKNFVTNFKHMIIGNPDGTDNNSNDLVFDIIAMERCTSPDKIGVEIYGLYNDFKVTYASTPDCFFIFGGNADANKLVVGNPGVTVSDLSAAGCLNQWRIGHPNPGTLPASPTPVSGTNYTNTYGVPVEISLAYSLTPTTSSDSTITIYTGKNASVLSARTGIAVSAQTTPHTVTQSLSFIISPGHVWQMSKTGSGTANLVTCKIVSTGI